MNAAIGIWLNIANYSDVFSQHEHVHLTLLLTDHVQVSQAFQTVS